MTSSTKSSFQFTVYGARGSHPVWGEQYRRYNGNTSCYVMESEQGILVIDAGTGLLAFTKELVTRTSIPPITILLTHLHLDHIIGLPALSLTNRQDLVINVLVHPNAATDWRAAIKNLISQPYWPINIDDIPFSFNLDELPSSEDSVSLMGITISWCPVQHPQGCISYKLESDGKRIVVATDREHGHKALDEAFLSFAKDADILIHDAQYTPDELNERRGWGHSSWEQAAQVAMRVKAKQLVLVSHDPFRSDDAIDQIVKQTSKIFSNTIAATEKMQLV